MPLISKNISAHIAMFTVALIYGLNYFISKVVFEYISPFGVLAMRSLSALLFFSILSLLFYREKIERKDIPRILFCAVSGITLNQLFFLWGLAKTTEINAAVLMITSPIFVFLLAYFTRSETITLRKIIGVVIAFAGAALLIVSEKKVDIGGATIQGDIMIIINAVAYSAYLIAVKPLVARYSPVFLFAVLFGTGGVVNIFIGMEDLLSANWASFPTNVMIGAMYIMICTTILAYLLNLWAMKTVPAGHVSIYVYLQPVIATIMTAIQPDKVHYLSLTKTVCIVLVFVGVGLVTLRKPALSHLEGSGY